MAKNSPYNNIHEVMLSICQLNLEIEAEKYFHTGDMAWLVRMLRLLERDYAISDRARKMLERDPWEFLGIAPC